MDHEQKIKELGGRIDFLRTMSLLCLMISSILTVLVPFLTHVLSSDIKIWLLSICGCGALGLCVALLMGRKDATITLFVTFVTALFSGLLLGVSIFSFGYEIKNG